eukprot:TRINITY_DN10657_c0_g1_i1.p1 TRINITY_DN10657_c0_g1~~TRINITY_DN10657_c0_g1_i1.p1  ORF type:complete len:297 (+),score=57.37 TRINITY_DN10657_c0_g1_i1:117-1007(+)
MLRSVQPFQKPSSFDRKKVDFHRIRSYQITDADLSWNRRTIYAFSSDANSMELVDRCNTRRKDESFLNHCLTNPNSRMVLFDDDLKPLVLTSAQKRGPVTVAWQPLALLKLDELKDAIPMKLNAIPKGLMLLGIKNDIPYFAIDTTQWPQFQVKQENSAKFLNLRAIAGDLNRSEGAMLAHAKTVLDWQRTHSFCSNCGKENRVAGMGTAFHCDSCKKEHHPRSDPAMIVLVSKGDRCLLGRQAVWEKGRYSTLAGFIEPGETIEDAVRREVWEESGIQVGQVLQLEFKLKNSGGI